MKKFITSLVIILSLCFYCSLFAEPTQEEIKTILPSFLNMSNESRDYWFTIPLCFEDESTGFGNFIKIFVTSKYKTAVTVSVPALGFKTTKLSIPNDVIEFNSIQNII